MTYIIVNILAYFHLVYSFSIQAKFDQVFGKPEPPVYRGPKYYLTPLKFVPTASAFIASYIPFMNVTKLEYHFAINFAIHFVVAIIASGLFQMIYLSTRKSITKQAGEHVWLSLGIGYALLIISLFI